MNPSYTGTVEALMPRVLHYLEQSVAGGPQWERYLYHAMMGLVGLYDREAETGPAAPDAMRAFRAQSGELLERLGRRTNHFVIDALGLAQSSRDEGWAELCMSRSAIQSLLDDYPGTGVAALVDQDELEELDERLREIAPDQTPVPEADQPRGLPADHWWWPLPQQLQS